MQRKLEHVRRPCPSWSSCRPIAHHSNTTANHLIWWRAEKIGTHGTCSDVIAC
jgi:hypothetical protein